MSTWESWREVERIAIVQPQAPMRHKQSELHSTLFFWCGQQVKCRQQDIARHLPRQNHALAAGVIAQLEMKQVTYPKTIKKTVTIYGQ